MAEIVISKMTKDDLEGIYEVEKTAFPIPWQISSFEEELKNMFATYLVAKIEERKEAKLAKNYARADEIRAELSARGVTLKDTKDGTFYTVE